MAGCVSLLGICWLFPGVAWQKPCALIKLCCKCYVALRHFFSLQPRYSVMNKTTNQPDLSENSMAAANDVVAVELLPYLLNRLTTGINRLWLKEIRRYGLTIPRWQVLSILKVMDGSRIGTIAELCGADQAIISRVIDQMEHDQLVRRQPAKADSRAVEVWMGDKGRQIHGDLMPLAEKQVDALVQHFSPAEAKALTSSLAKMLDGMDDISQRLEQP